jgi:hypothetical protein
MVEIAIDCNLQLDKSLTLGVAQSVHLLLRADGVKDDGQLDAEVQQQINPEPKEDEEREETCVQQSEKRSTVPQRMTRVSMRMAQPFMRVRINTANSPDGQLSKNPPSCKHRAAMIAPHVHPSHGQNSSAPQRLGRVGTGGVLLSARTSTVSGIAAAACAHEIWVLERDGCIHTHLGAECGVRR